MRSATMMKLMISFYIFLFFLYLFGPLIIMSITAFNSSDFPRVSPWDCFTLEWFPKLREDRFLVEGFKNSLIIGAGVITLAVPIGLAGALLLTQLGRKARSGFYTVMISPILVPGVVLGISTIIFWRRLGEMIGVAGEDNILYEGLFMTILGQSTFISAFTMLVFIARLQRFDPAQEEAALDLGATKPQAFRKILLPFLKPAIGSAAVLAFLASFENYNTTVFTILQDKTLTTVLASKVRYGIDPSISALAVLIVSLTLIGAFVYEVLRRREQREAMEIEARARAAERIDMQEAVQSETTRDDANAPAAAPAPSPAPASSGFQIQTHHIAIVLALIAVAGIGKLMLSDQVYDAAVCKEAIRLEKMQRQQELMDQQRKLLEERQEKQQQEQAAPKSEGGQKDYDAIFAPQNLQDSAGQDSEGGESGAGESGQKDYNDIFAPQNLQDSGPGADESAPAQEPAGEKDYNSIFAPDNLQQNAPKE